MNTPIDVDAVVREVLAELARRNGRPAAEASNHVFAGKLFGLSQAETVNGETKAVRLNAGTVVTPLARDLLKRKGIAVEFVSGVAQAKGTGEWAFATEVQGSGKAEALRRELLNAWAEVAPDLASRWVVERPDRGALLLSREASVAAWRANRAEGVRAAVASDVDAVVRAVRALGVNFLVIEPEGLSIPSVKAMADAFRRGGAPVVPEGLR